MPNVQIGLKLKDNEINCIISSDLILDINDDIKIKCTPDFNPHLYQFPPQVIPPASLFDDIRILKNSVGFTRATPTSIVT